MKTPRKLKQQPIQDDQKTIMDKEAGPASTTQRDDKQLTLFDLPKSTRAKRALLSDLDTWNKFCNELAAAAHSPELFPQPRFCTPGTARRIKKDLVRLVKPSKNKRRRGD